MKDLKYLLAYVAPLSAFVGLYFQGWLSPGSFYIAFVIIPIFELFSSGSTDNLSEEEESSKKESLFFDILLYLNLPILFALVTCFLYTVTTLPLSNWEIFFSIINVGILVSTLGINVAHELGHRQNKWEQGVSKLMLMTALYTHFFIEHNRGHHMQVATPEDPASARYNEVIYTFWFRSTVFGYLNAWKLESKRLRNLGVSPYSLQNEMISLQLLQVVYLITIGVLFGGMAILYAVAIAVVGFLLLETVNYIEHYGLSRARLPNGKYEKIQPWHSWNSNHDLGRIYLYELTRHSDHHFKSNRKYQLLRNFEESPQLPFGYPGSMIIALIPPVWFVLMNKRVQALRPA